MNMGQCQRAGGVAEQHLVFHNHDASRGGQEEQSLPWVASPAVQHPLIHVKPTSLPVSHHYPTDNQ